MRSCRVVPLLLLLLLGAAASPLQAARTEFSLGTGYLYGFTRYQIGGHVAYTSGTQANYHFPISELKFPLDAPMLRAELAVKFDNRLRLRFDGQTNLSEKTGKMEDSDWQYTAGQLDTFSRSDTRMRAWLTDAAVEYVFGEKAFGASDVKAERAHAKLYGGLGFKYQKFAFDCSNLQQWNYLPPPVTTTSVSGLALKYEVEYRIPYLIVGVDIAGRGKVTTNLHLGVSPFLHVEDKDQHLLRDKVSMADHGWGGYALFLGAKGRYALGGGWYLDGNLSLMALESEGVAKATFSGADAIYDHSIDEQIKSQQLSGFVALGYEF